MTVDEKALEQILRETIKVDATGLAPAIVGHYITGFDEAVRRIRAYEAAKAPPGEVVAWRWRFEKDQSWRIAERARDIPHLSQWPRSEIQPLYASPAPEGKG